MWWNNVETKPYGGYPHHWDAKLLAMLEQANPGGQVWDAGREGRRPYGSFEGKTIFEAAEKASARRGRRRPGLPAHRGGVARAEHLRGHGDRRRRAAAQYARAGPGSRRTASGSSTWPGICNHCTYPGCWPACPRKAIYKRPEDGIVLIDQARCRGYRKCVEGCPYKKVMYRGHDGTSEKCVGCYPASRAPTRSPRACRWRRAAWRRASARSACRGWSRSARTASGPKDPENPLYYLVQGREGGAAAVPAVRHRAERLLHPAALGPARVPHADVRPRGGRGDRALQPARTGSCWRSSSCSGAQRQILFKFQIEKGPKVRDAMIGGRKWAMYDDTVIGYDRDGSEAVRLPGPLHYDGPARDRTGTRAEASGTDTDTAPAADAAEAPPRRAVLGLVLGSRIRRRPSCGTCSRRICRSRSRSPRRCRPAWAEALRELEASLDGPVAEALEEAFRDRFTHVHSQDCPLYGPITSTGRSGGRRRTSPTWAGSTRRSARGVGRARGPRLGRARVPPRPGVQARLGARARPGRARRGLPSGRGDVPARPRVPLAARRGRAPRNGRRGQPVCGRRDVDGRGPPCGVRAHGGPHHCRGRRRADGGASRRSRCARTPRERSPPDCGRLSAGAPWSWRSPSLSPGC